VAFLALVSEVVLAGALEAVEAGAFPAVEAGLAGMFDLRVGCVQREVLGRGELEKTDGRRQETRLSYIYESNWVTSRDNVYTCLSQVSTPNGQTKARDRVLARFKKAP